MKANYGVFESFKKRTKHTQDSILSVFCLLFGRIRDFIICFWDLLTFRMKGVLLDRVDHRFYFGSFKNGEHSLFMTLIFLFSEPFEVCGYFKCNAVKWSEKLFCSCTAVAWCYAVVPHFVWKAKTLFKYLCHRFEVK